MPRINNDSLYPITTLLDGATFIGSAKDGKTIQISVEGILAYVTSVSDYVLFQNASKAGQVVLGNDPNNPETATPLNDNEMFLGVLKVFPPVTDADIKFITKIRT